MENQVAQDFSSWYAGSTILALATVVGNALYGFYTSRGGEPLLGGRILSD